MTNHERLMLRRHLERAAASYDAIVANVRGGRPPHLGADFGEEVCRFYKELAAESRDFAARLRIGSL